MSEETTHMVPYRTQIAVLLALLVLTGLSVAITQLEFGSYNTLAAMLLAGAKAVIVLAWYMHLKYEKQLFPVMVAAVFVIFLLVLFVTFFDYSYR